MRRILVDHARAKHAAKRPSSRQKIDLEDAPMFAEEHFDGIIALDQALEKLSLLDDRQSRIVELRYFGGLTTEEAADALGVTAITVHRDWRVAKAWLRRELSSQESAAT
jgi:RNA polymerase sigma factor (TIGR02999 family)